MKRFRYSVAGKSIAVCLLALMAAASICLTILFAFNLKQGIYYRSEHKLRENIIEEMMWSDCYEVGMQYEHLRFCEENYPNYGSYEFSPSPDDSNFRFTLYNAETEQELAGTYMGEDYWASKTVFTTADYPWWDEELGDYTYLSTYLKVDGYVLLDLSVRDRYWYAWNLVHIWYVTRYAVPIAAVLCLGAAAALYISLICAAGRRPGREDVIKNRGVDRIPFDVLLILILIPAIVTGIYVMDYVSSWGVTLPAALLIGAVLVMGALVLTLLSMTFAVRVKLGCLIRDCLIYRILRWCLRICKKIRDGIRCLFRSIPLLWQVAAGLVVLTVIEALFLAGIYYSSDLLPFWILEKVVLIPLILGITLMLRRLEKTGRDIAAGHAEARVDTKWMLGPFKRHGENLNSIQEGINLAVEDKMKSERLRTELITNVSHDIKTPLTSIINYVDLIKKEDPGTEPMHEYINVLDRQSMRLKKLIEDLVEASKASTGNLPVTLEPCEAGVILGQAVGEYEERLNNAGLELVMRIPEEPVMILADGRHLWRIFDNLLGNICKYSLANTRVYINLEQSEGKAVITFRNISRSSLNISSDELKERFVRGDSSRNTEGSGLGLSIAESLALLQNGTIDLVVDGDLFKVIVTFEAVRALQ